MIDQNELNDWIRKIEGYARGYGLDFFPTMFEMVDFNGMNEVASYGGFPVRYPHWRFGMQYQYMEKSYSYGLHKIYEMVINNNPCYAYLLDSNKMVDQKMVVAHVYAHCDFFKNNAYFANTNRKMMDEMANHGTRIRRYCDRYGLDVVEDFLETCFSLENLIDPNSAFVDESTKGVKISGDDDADLTDVPKIKSKSYMDEYINPPSYLEQRREEMLQDSLQEAKFPPQPEKDVLLFLLQFAPLPNWKRDILSIIREEAYYFAPQAQTKIMNEGWATYWHTKMMTKKCLDDSELIDYADHQSGTLGVQPGQINPYKLGYELYKDIEERWNMGRFGKEYDECTDIQERTAWDTGVGLGREKIFQVRSIYNDMTFIDDFLTEDFCRDHKMFSYKFNEKSGMYEIDDRSIGAIKEKLLFQLTNMGHPYITVVEGDFENRAELYLKHRHDGIDLRIDYAKATIEKLFNIWGRTVHLQTLVGEAICIHSFDGTVHKERTVSEQTAA